jgi:hypothetical protein
MRRAARVALGFFAVVWLSVGSRTSAFSAVSYQVSVIGGTARCDGGIGSALPAGHYQAMAVAMDENGRALRYLTNPVPLTVAPK